MKNVSNTWRSIQGKEVRPKTDVKGHFVGKQAKPYYCRNGKLSRNNDIKFLLNDAFAFKCKGYDPSNPSYYQVDYFFDEAVEITPSKLKFMFYGIILNENNLLIGLNDVNNLVLYSTIKNSNTPVSCTSLSFSISYNSTTTWEWGLYYCELNGNGVDITSDEIKQLSYKAHVDVLNKDLPYHKIDLQTLKLYSPNEIQCALFFVGYPSINEYVFLGCGYYYLQEYKKQGINQILKFVDCLSTMTNLYCYSRAYQVVGAFDPRSIIKWATHYHASFGLNNLAQWRSWLPTYNFQNIDISSTKLDATSLDNFRPIGNKSCAEVLKDVAVAYGLTLYVNGENQIVFEDLQAKSSIYDSNKLWLMESPKNDDLDKVGTLTRQIHSYGETENPKVLYEQEGTEDKERILVLDENYSYSNLLRINGVDVTSLGYGTFNTVKFAETVGTTTTITNIATRLSICDRSKTTVFSGSDINYNVVIDTTGNNADAHLGIDYAVYWLNRMGNYGKTSINVRLDPKYEVCDILNNEKYGEFVVCDINATYNGAYSGGLSGVARLPFIEAPIVSNIQTDNNYLACDIFNPNEKTLELVIRNEDWDIEHRITMKPFETIHYDSSDFSHDDICIEVVKYNNGVLFYDILVQFDYEDNYAGTTRTDYSPTTLILKANNVPLYEKPSITVEYIDADNDFQFEIENTELCPVNLVVWYDNQTKTKVFRVEAQGLLYLNDGNFAELGVDVERYIDETDGNSPFCYFETLDGLVRSHANILFELNHSIPLPPILNYKYLSDGFYGFNILNSNTGDMWLWVDTSDEQESMQIAGNYELLLDNGLTYEWLQEEVIDYINENLDVDVVAYFDDQHDVSNNTILLERNN